MVKIQRDTYDFSYEQSQPVQEQFFSIKGRDLERNRKEPPHAVTYLNLLRNIGTIDWYTGIPIDEDAVPKYFVGKNGKYIPNPDYQGEAFFIEIEDATDLTSSTAESVFRPNSITVQANVQAPGILVINQNYHKDWHTNRGQLLNKDGLIALRLRETGSYAIRLRYIPRSFYVGLAISVFSLAALVLISWAYVTGRLLKWSQHDTAVLRICSKTILWLTD